MVRVQHVEPYSTVYRIFLFFSFLLLFGHAGRIESGAYDASDMGMDG